MGPLIDDLAVGERRAWLLLAVVWAGALTAAWLAGRLRRRGGLALTSLALLTLALAPLSYAAASAVALPHIRWRAERRPDLVLESGSTWRRLRGHTVHVLVNGEPEIAVPTIDREGAWVLFGLFSGRRIRGLPAADNAAVEPGSSRLCTQGEPSSCRPWPGAWPDPERPPRLAAFLWSSARDPHALAVDHEAGLYLRAVQGADEEGRALELSGRLSSDAFASRDGTIAAALRVAHGRLEGVRLRVEGPATNAPEERRYALDAFRVSLVRAPAVFRHIARPLLAVAVALAPLSLLAWALAPGLVAARLRRRARFHALDTPATLVPEAPPSGLRAVALLATPARLGDLELDAGLRVALATPDGAEVTSKGWYEVREVAGEGSIPGAPPDVEGLLLIPADGGRFAPLARAWVARHLVGVLVFALGLAAVAPALPALAALL